METKNPYTSEKRPDWEVAYQHLNDEIKELRKESSINRSILIAIYSKLTNKTIGEASEEFDKFSQPIP